MAAATAAAGPGSRARRGRRRGRAAAAAAADEEAGPGPAGEAAAHARCVPGPGRRRRRCPEPAGGAGEQRAPEPDFIFRAPIKLSKPGELREEYESQLKKLREEKLQEEKTSEDLIHKLILEDMEVGKRKMEEQKKEEPLMLKMNQECFPERLSDSENEEPFQGKQMHRSAFVSKGSAYSFPFFSGSLTSKVERSQSCSDTLQDRSKSRQRAAPASKTKVMSATSTSTPIGVLLSTQNNRCLSAPDLTAEKRLTFNSASSLSTLHKPERSISPESNDSISEELNHFKPIVCSPCTPPKRLPDGRVLSPLIIKSTPRNLSRSLQKPTTYEASPRILKKWEQIFQERQIKKTLSKATLTSLASETGEDFLVPDIAHSLHSSKEHPRMLNDQVPPDTATDSNMEIDYSPSISKGKPEGASDKKRGSQTLTVDNSSCEPNTRTNRASLNAQDTVDVKANSYVDKSCLSVGTKIMTRRIIGANPAPPDSSPGGVLVKTAGKKQLKYLNNSELINVQNGTCNSVENVSSEQPPSLRRGRKRCCKTKHLEQNGSVKRLRQTAGEMGLAVDDPLVREMEQKLQQEEEDRRLALQLQQIFDSENRTVDRRKGRVDQYLLRSKSTTGAK
ncbi:E3 ubiquitin-protein ligase RNF169 [Alligator mississippiensis]|uniref:E3 ubiquitin-protein ligase RNF169 n=1 Tax=Alligator mississippiensis TaxID=8496 RepID=UPI0028777AF4|nr:E3 ubiquitin-protein ligase RNF169 [Alligator mississippiensis]